LLFSEVRKCSRSFCWFGLEAFLHQELCALMLQLVSPVAQIAGFRKQFVPL
jgi:hypothetical protein